MHVLFLRFRHAVWYSLLGLIGLLYSFSAQAQSQYCVVGDFNGWVTPCAEHYQLTDQGDGTFSRTISVSATAGHNWTSYKIYDVSGSTWHGALWSEQDTSDHSNMLLVFPAVDETHDVTFYFDTQDLATQGWIPPAPTYGDDWNASHTMTGAEISATSAHYWLATGDYEVSSGTSYFSGASGPNCASWPSECSALRMHDDTIAGSWDQTPNDGTYTLGLVVPVELAEKDIYVKAITSNSDWQNTTRYGFNGWNFVQSGTPPSERDASAVLIHLPARGQVILEKFDALHGRLGLENLPAPKLLLSELQTAPDSNEFIEIYNPNDFDVPLNNYYLSNDASYPQISSGTISHAGHFVYNFDADARIAAHSYATIALHADSGISVTSGELYTASGLDGNALNEDSGFVALFYWDGINDLVMDSDYLAYGGISETPMHFDDVDSLTDYDDQISLYPSPVTFDPAFVAASPSSGHSLVRFNYDEVGFDGSDHPQAASDATTHYNGMSDEDESSEYASLTWIETTNPTPGADLLANAQTCDDDSQCQSQTCRISPSGSSFCVAAGFLCSDDSGQGLVQDEAVCSDGNSWTCDSLNSINSNSCIDSLTCTTDSCDATSGLCLYTVNAGSCAIENACYADDAVNPNNDCLFCNAAQPGSWSFASAGTSCDDGDSATSGTVCNDQGQCVVPSGADAGVEDAAVEDAALEDAALEDAAVEDAAVITDAYVGTDATTESDATAAADAAIEPDAAVVADAHVDDASPASDAAVNDANTNPDSATADDAAVVADATVSTDAGLANNDATVDNNAPRINPEASGCGCASSGQSKPGTAIWFAFALGMILIRRRRG